MDWMSVAGVIGNGLKSTDISTPGDFNTPIGVGSWYYWGSNATNTPDGYDIAYGKRVVFYSSDNSVFEIFYSLNNSKLYVRGQAWTSAWKQINLS